MLTLGWTEDRQRDRGTDRETETDRGTDRERDRDRQRDRQRQLVSALSLSVVNYMANRVGFFSPPR